MILRSSSFVGITIMNPLGRLGKRVLGWTPSLGKRRVERTKVRLSNDLRKMAGSSCMREAEPSDVQSKRTMSSSGLR